MKSMNQIERKGCKMRTYSITLLAAILILPVAVSAQGLARDYRGDDNSRGPLDVEVWLDNSDGIYYEGENINVHFRASRDCFVALYSVDTRGQLNLLYPIDPQDDGYIQGGEVYSVPGQYADFDLVVTGPEGIEHIQAVASLDRMPIPDWYNGSPERADYDTDRASFVRYINDRYFGCRWDDCVRAFSHATVYVKGPHYYYKPVHVPRPWYDSPNYAVMYVDYPYGGEVYIDGIFIGFAPLWIPRIMIGWHWFTIYDRYGYCWEDRMDFRHNNTIYIDRTRVKTSRTVVSRFKEVRTQAQKFDRTSLVMSDKRVKSVRAESGKGLVRNERGNVVSKESRGADSRRYFDRKDSDRYSRQRDQSSGKSSSDGWNTPRDNRTKRGGESEGYRKPAQTQRAPDRYTPSSPSRRSTGSQAKPSSPAPSKGGKESTSPTKRSPDGDSGSGKKSRGGSSDISSSRNMTSTPPARQTERTEVKRSTDNSQRKQASVTPAPAPSKADKSGRAVQRESSTRTKRGR